MSEALQEAADYQLNPAGQALLKQYHDVIQDIEKNLLPVVRPYVKDPINSAKEIAVAIISSINSQQLGSQAYEIMTRLDTLTNGGKSTIKGSDFGFNQNDKILNYLEQVQQR